MNLLLGLFFLALSEGIAIDRLPDQANQGPTSEEIVATSDIMTLPIERLIDPAIKTLEEEPSNRGTEMVPGAPSRQLDPTTSQDTYDAYKQETTIDAVFCQQPKYPVLVSCHSEEYANALKNDDPSNTYFKEPGTTILRGDCFLADDIGFDLTLFGLCCPLQKDRRFGFPCLPVVP